MKKIHKILLLIILIEVIAIVVMNQDFNKGNQKDDETIALSEQKENPKEEKLKIKEPETYEASIASIGDVLIHSRVYNDAYIGKKKYDFSKMLKQVKPYLENPDITVANSESIIGGTDIGLSTYPRFNSPYEVGDALKDVGVDLVTMANNHTLDRGEQAIINATNYWDKIGILHVGAARNQEEADKIITMTANNITFSFLGYTYGTNGIPVPQGKEYLVNYIDLPKMQSDIKRAKEISDVVVVNLHMGNEYERKVNENQSQVAQKLADFGADIIFAHHPHVLQPTKWYKGVNGNKTFVIHSLGNFLSGQKDLYTRIGGIVQLDVKKTVTYDKNNKPTTTIELLNPKLLPTFVKFRYEKNYEVYPLSKVTNADLSNAQGRYEEIKNYMKQYMPELQFIE